MNSPPASPTRRNFLVGAATMLGAGAMGIFPASAADAPESLGEYAGKRMFFSAAQSAIFSCAMHLTPACCQNNAESPCLRTP